MFCEVAGHASCCDGYMCQARIFASLINLGAIALALGCSSVDSSSGQGDAAGGPQKMASATGGDSQGAGGANGGDPQGTGGANGGDPQGTGGANGGATAGSGGTAVDGCRSDAECYALNSTGSTSSTCVEPVPSASSLAATTNVQTCQPAFRDWCGLCSCPPAPEPCTLDTDCPAEQPYCAQFGVGTAMVFACSECETDADCGDASPHCVTTSSAKRVCRPCQTTDDCAEGICGYSFSCEPGCAVDGDCADSLDYCTPEKRCEPRPCASSSDCPAISACNADGICERWTCQSDDDCGGSPCVKSQCFESLGHCTYIFYPY